MGRITRDRTKSQSIRYHLISPLFQRSQQNMLKNQLPVATSTVFSWRVRGGTSKTVRYASLNPNNYIYQCQRYISFPKSAPKLIRLGYGIHAPCTRLRRELVHYRQLVTRLITS